MSTELHLWIATALITAFALGAGWLALRLIRAIEGLRTSQVEGQGDARQLRATADAGSEGAAQIASSVGALSLTSAVEPAPRPISSTLAQV